MRGGTQWPCALRTGLVALVVLGFLVVAPGAAAGVYPDPPPTFPNQYANTLFNPLGGSEARPLLVIYASWTDIGYPPQFDAAAVAQRYFGTGFPSLSFPSVGNYFYETSFRHLYVFPAQETQGTPNDGIAQVQVPMSKADFFKLSTGARDRMLLQLADPYVDFAGFDTNGDGKVTPDELTVDALEAAPETPLWQGLGIMQPGVGALTLDGVSVGGLNVAMVNTSSPMMDLIHENGHAIFGMPDTYGFGTGRFDIGGTIGPPDNAYVAPNAWEKIHLGWITPKVVTKDGFYDVGRADTSGDAFVLYDPGHGTDEYLLVENREQTTGTYDQGASDSGLVIWRVKDSALGTGQYIELLGPSGSAAPPDWRGSSRDAWNPSDPNTPERTFAGTWQDGTTSNLAVRAIGPAGDTIRVYLDVRGPGLLVDTYPLDGTAPVTLTAGRYGVVDVPIMNTDDVISGQVPRCDEFPVDAVQLPPGWSMVEGVRILCAGESTFARVQIKPDPGTAVGDYTIGIRGHGTFDPSVDTTVPLQVHVVLPRTTFNTGDLVTSAATGGQAVFVAQDSSPDDPQQPPVPGVPVTFTLAGDGGALVLRATTDAKGIARASGQLDLPPGTYTLTIESSRFGEFAGTSTAVAYTVDKRPTKLVYTGALEGDYSDRATVSARLADALTNTALAGKTVDFTLGAGDTCSAQTDASGVASCGIPPTQPAATVDLGAAFAGDGVHQGSSDSERFDITKEETTVSYVGPTAILQAGGGVTLSAQLTAEGADNGDGDAGSTPLAGRSVQLSLGGQSCAGATDAGGTATCALTFTGALGPQPLNARFGGDSYYAESGDSSKTAVVFAFPSRGVFVAGDRSVAAAGVTGAVRWWGGEWASRNTLTGGAAPAAFKGFGASAALPGRNPADVCAGSFTTGPGDSGQPPASVPSYMGIVVASSVAKSGSTISGAWARIVVIKTDPGYAGDPGHSATGTIVATFCP